MSIADSSSFDHALRVAKCVSDSELIPAQFQGKVANCVIALEMAGRMGASPLAVMQNLYVVHGKPSFGSTFIIGLINTSGRFEPLKFDIKRLGSKEIAKTKFDDAQCIAWTVDAGVKLPPDASTLDTAKAKGFNVLESPPVTVEMAVKEGWYTKNGSKWQTMPDLMLRYRAATFFGRLYAADLLMGMRTREEMIDVGDEVIDVSGTEPEIKINKEPVRAKKAKVVETTTTVTASAPETKSEPQATEPVKAEEKPAEDKQQEAPAEAAEQKAEPKQDETKPSDPEPKAQDKPKELHEEVRQFFNDAVNADFKQLKATMTRMGIAWMGQYESFADMSQKHLNNIWNSRRGLLPEIVRDMQQKPA